MEFYIPIPPIPPIAPIPPAGIPGVESFSSGLSATIASVVTSKPEIEAASWRAVLTTNEVVLNIYFLFFFLDKPNLSLCLNLNTTMARAIKTIAIDS